LQNGSMQVLISEFFRVSSWIQASIAPEKREKEHCDM